MPITFDLQGGELKIPVVGQYDINLPLFFATKTKKGWKLLDPMTTIRNLAKRKGKLVMDLNRKAIEEPSIGEDTTLEVPKIGDFSKADQVKLRKFEAELGSDQKYGPHNPIKPRGTPVFLPKNGAKHGFKHQPNIGYKYGDNPSKKNPVVHPKRGRPKLKKGEDESSSEEEEEKEKRPRGRPSMTAEQKAKTAAERKEKKDKEYAAKEPEREAARKAYWEERVKDRDAYWENMKKKEEEKKAKEDEREEYWENMRKEKKAKEDEKKPSPPKSVLFNPTGNTNNVKIKQIKKELERLGNEDQIRFIIEGGDEKVAHLKKMLSNLGGKGLKGGSAFSGLLDKVGSLVMSGVDTVTDIGNKVINGRNDYPPHVKRILEKYGDKKVIGLALHRLVLNRIFTDILSVWTKGETAKRIAEEPKDKLFHISMWVTLEGGTVILCEKNEVISMTVSPRKGEHEEEQAAKTPENTTLAALLANGQAEMGDKYFTYSAKDNNCGNWIEGILRGNKLNDEATHAFIGQDAQKILEGFPQLRKFMNTLTDVAGRANVVLEGGNLNPDWEHMKWGSFTKQFERYKEEHPDTELNDLEDFAEAIIHEHSKFQPRTVKRARFYLNVILKKKSHHNNIMPSNRVSGGAVMKMPNGITIGVGSDGPRMLGGDPRTWSSPALHSNHPNAMDTIFHAPNMVGQGFREDIMRHVNSAIPSAGSNHAEGIHHHHHYHMGGMGFFDDIGKAFNPQQNGVAKAFDPQQNGVAEAFKPGGSAERFGLDRLQDLRNNYRPLIHAGVGTAITGLTGVPLSGTLAGQMGLNQKIDEGLDRANLGFGLKGCGKKRFVKGSAEAKAYMASIRKKKSSGGMIGGPGGVFHQRGGEIPGPPSRSPITDPSLLGRGMY